MRKGTGGMSMGLIRGVRSKPFNKKVGVVFNRFLLLFFVLFSIILSEVLLRFFYPQPLMSFGKYTFKHSPDFGFIFEPKRKSIHSQPEYTYEIVSNSFGFRGKEPNFKALNRILILGDSFAMGQGASEGKYASALSESYFAQNGLSVDIFNTAISGYAGINQLPILKKFAPLYKPQLVVLFFSWNDVGVLESLTVLDGYLFLGEAKKLGYIREWLNNNSHLFALIKRFYYLNLKKSQGVKNAGEKSQWIYSESDIDIAMSYIRQMKHISDKNGSLFVVFIVPLPFKGDKATVKGEDSFINSLKLDAIVYYDISSMLPTEKNLRDNLYFTHDGHWTEYGNYYISQHLNKLIENNIYK